MRSPTSLVMAAVLTAVTVVPPAGALAQVPQISAQPSAPQPSAPQGSISPIPEAPGAVGGSPPVSAAPSAPSSARTPRGPLLPPYETARPVWAVDNTVLLVGLGAMFGVFAFNWLAPTVATGAARAGRVLANTGAFFEAVAIRLGLRGTAVAGAAAARAGAGAVAPAAAPAVVRAAAPVAAPAARAVTGAAGAAARAAAPAAGALTDVMIHHSQAAGAAAAVAGGLVGHYLYKLGQLFSPATPSSK